jgi:multidrug efflux pump subunit AcrB
MVTLSQPGAAPAQLETEIARKVEDSLSTLQGLKHLRTTVTSGRVSIVVEFELAKNLSDAVSETKNAVDQARGDLPNDMQPPIITALTVNGQAMLTYAISSTRMDEEALSWFVDDTVGRTVLAVPGVGKYERIGGVQREVLVEIDPVRAAGLGITPAQVSRALRQVQQESSGGRGQIGGAEQAVRTVSMVSQAGELAAVPVVLPNGRSIRLEEVATITDGIGERSQTALLNGKPVVGFRMYRSRGYDEVETAKGVKDALEKLGKSDPTLTVTLISDNVRYTLDQYEGSMHLLYEGAGLAVLVVFLFLRDWRATLISAAALPLSILPAFAAMAWLGYSLNTLTLLALAVIVGILVDDAIVEIENVERHVHMGKSVEKATEDAVNEIALAVIATTMSLVVVFLPTALMSGVPGLFFRQFGWTVVIAVLASLLVARLLTPMLAAKFLKPKPLREESDGPVMSRYLIMVDWCLRHRKTTIGAATAFFVLSVAMLPFIPTGFIPAGDRGVTFIRIQLPPGTAMERTQQVAEEARLTLAKIPGIENVYTTVGQAPIAGRSAQGGEVRNASLLVMLSPRETRAPQNEIETAARKALRDVAGAKFDIGFGGNGEKVQVTLASADIQALKASAQASNANCAASPRSRTSPRRRLWNVPRSPCAPMPIGPRNAA